MSTTMAPPAGDGAATAIIPTQNVSELTSHRSLHIIILSSSSNMYLESSPSVLYLILTINHRTYYLVEVHSPTNTRGINSTAH